MVIQNQYKNIRSIFQAFFYVGKFRITFITIFELVQVNFQLYTSSSVHSSDGQDIPRNKLNEILRCFIVTNHELFSTSSSTSVFPAALTVSTRVEASARGILGSSSAWSSSTGHCTLARWTSCLECGVMAKVNMVFTSSNQVVMHIY